MKRNLQTILTATTASFLTLTVLAQDSARPTADRPDYSRHESSQNPRADRLNGAVKASELIGMDVKTYQDEKLGTVEDLAIDLESGRIVQVIMSSGGVLGIGSSLKAVPPGALHHDTAKKVVHLSADKAQLESAAKFDMDKWAESSSSTHLAATYRHFGEEPALNFINHGQGETHRGGLYNQTDRSFEQRNQTDGSFDQRNQTVQTTERQRNQSSDLAAEQRHQAALTVQRDESNLTSDQRDHANRIADRRDQTNQTAEQRNQANLTAQHNLSNQSADQRNQSNITAGQRNQANQTGDQRNQSNVTADQRYQANQSGERNQSNLTAGQRNQVNQTGERNQTNITADQRNQAGDQRNQSNLTAAQRSQVNQRAGWDKVETGGNDQKWDQSRSASGGQDMIPSERLGNVQRASKLIGMTVKNRQDETIGDVENVLVDLSSGRLVAVVISSGGFLGMGDELSAVPPTALRFSEDRDSLQLDASKEQLTSAPHFKANQWPDYSKSEQAEGLYRAYEVEPYFASDDTKDADNTQRNVRDRNDQSLTPLDQGNSQSDISTTASIRRAIGDNDKMSVNAKNVKIITKDGRVTLRGPVNSNEEKRLIGEIANRIARAGNVDNQLEVKITTSGL